MTRVRLWPTLINMEGTPTRRYPTKASGVPAALEQRSFAVLRPVDARDVYAGPPKEFERLSNRGALHKLATGYYAIVPPRHRTTGGWMPALEAAAFGIAAADYGPGHAVLMGLSAARLHGAVPRALAVAVVAIDKNRRLLRLTDRPAAVQFVRRETGRLDAERVPTELGPALVTGLEQTLLDLAHRPALGGVGEEARAAVQGLWPRCDKAVLAELAAQQRLRAALARAQDWARE